MSLESLRMSSLCERHQTVRHHAMCSTSGLLHHSLTLNQNVFLVLVLGLAILSQVIYMIVLIKNVKKTITLISVILKQQGMSQVKIAGVIPAKRKAAKFGPLVWQNLVWSNVFIKNLVCRLDVIIIFMQNLMQFEKGTMYK